jgi:hypothetical protein
MTGTLLVSVSLVTVLLVGSAVAGMQHRMGGQAPMESQAEPQEPSSGQHQMMGRGMRGHGMMGHGMMGMLCPMMAMMVDPVGMAGMGSKPMDPKAVGRLLQLRGDMLKAVGEVLLKHGKAMEESQ